MGNSVIVTAGVVAADGAAPPRAASPLAFSTDALALNGADCLQRALHSSILHQTVRGAEADEQVPSISSELESALAEGRRLLQKQSADQADPSRDTHVCK